MIKNIKTTNGILYLLYQTDIWKSKSSYVCFGVFDSFEHANEQAKKNDLYKNDASHKYYLLVSKSAETPETFNKVCNILSEYALQNRYVESAEAYFGEHFKCITSHDALQRLAQL